MIAMRSFSSWWLIIHARAHMYTRAGAKRSLTPPSLPPSSLFPPSRTLAHTHTQEEPSAQAEEAAAAHDKPTEPEEPTEAGEPTEPEKPQPPASGPGAETEAGGEGSDLPDVAGGVEAAHEGVGDEGRADEEGSGDGESVGWRKAVANPKKKSPNPNS
jgi:hypothetical protein